MKYVWDNLFGFTIVTVIYLSNLTIVAVIFWLLGIWFPLVGPDDCPDNAYPDDAYSNDAYPESAP